MEPSPMPFQGQSKARGRKAWSLMDQESNVASAGGENTGTVVAAVSMSPTPTSTLAEKKWLMNTGEEECLQQKRAGGDGAVIVLSVPSSPGLQQSWSAGSGMTCSSHLN